MRFMALTALSACVICGCASVPPASTASELASITGATPGMIAAAQSSDQANLQTAQLTEIRNAEARLDLARARLDFSSVRQKGAEDGDVREFLAARRDLRHARNVFGPTDTGRREISIFALYPYGRSWPQPDRNWLTEPNSDPDRLTGGAAQPLSAIKR